MQICDFTYHRPRSVAEACELAVGLGNEALFLAGGTELVPDFKRGRESAQHLISLRDVPGLDGIRVVDDGLHIGAMTRLADIADSPDVRREYPALAEAAATIGGSQIRHQGTIGGNFCRAVSCADTPPACIVGRARVSLTGPKGERSIAAEEFFTGPRQTVLRPAEILLEILIPKQPPASGASYQRFALRQGSALAVASVAASVTLDGKTIRDARVALGAVAPVPLLVTACSEVLAGQPLSADLFARAAKVAAREATPISDIRGSAEYRRQLVCVLAARALAAAAARARGE